MKEKTTETRPQKKKGVSRRLDWKHLDASAVLVGVWGTYWLFGVF